MNPSNCGEQGFVLCLLFKHKLVGARSVAPGSLTFVRFAGQVVEGKRVQGGGNKELGAVNSFPRHSK